MKVVKIKKQKALKSVSCDESLNWEIIKTDQKQLNLKIRYTIQKKYEINVDVIQKDQKEFIKTIN